MLFRRVRDTVLSSTDRRQEPFTYGSIGGEEFYLNDGTRRTELARVAQTTPGGAGFQQVELAFCTGVKESTDIATIQNYLDQFPNGMCVSLAQSVLDKLGVHWSRQRTTVAARDPDTGSSSGTRAAVESKGTATSRVDQPSEETAKISTADGSKLGRDLQTQLKRVGCYSGAVDGKWTAKGKDALKDFVKYAKVSLSIDEPTVTALDAVTSKTERVCPLECDSDETEVNGRCVASKPSKPRQQQSAEPAPATAPNPRLSCAGPSRGRAVKTWAAKRCAGPWARWSSCAAMTPPRCGDRRGPVLTSTGPSTMFLPDL